MIEETTDATHIQTYTAPKELKGVVEWDGAAAPPAAERGLPHLAWLPRRAGYRMEKVEEEGTVTLRFTPCATAEKALNKTPCK